MGAGQMTSGLVCSAWPPQKGAKKRWRGAQRLDFEIAACLADTRGSRRARAVWPDAGLSVFDGVGVARRRSSRARVAGRAGRTDIDGLRAGQRALATTEDPSSTSREQGSGREHLSGRPEARRSSWRAAEGRGGCGTGREGGRTGYSHPGCSHPGPQQAPTSGRRTTATGICFWRGRGTVVAEETAAVPPSTAPPKPA